MPRRSKKGKKRPARVKGEGDMGGRTETLPRRSRGMTTVRIKMTEKHTRDRIRTNSDAGRKEGQRGERVQIYCTAEGELCRGGARYSVYRSSEKILPRRRTGTSGTWGTWGTEVLQRVVHVVHVVHRVVLVVLVVLVEWYFGYFGYFGYEWYFGGGTRGTCGTRGTFFAVFPRIIYFRART